MKLKPLFRLSQKMKLHYVKYFKLCLGLSIAAILGTIVLLSTTGLNFGIDFKGGTLIQIETPSRNRCRASQDHALAIGAWRYIASGLWLGQ